MHRLEMKPLMVGFYIQDEINELNISYQGVQDLPKLDTHRNGKYKDIQVKNSEEKDTELVKDFHEKVPK